MQISIVLSIQEVVEAMKEHARDKQGLSWPEEDLDGWTFTTTFGPRHAWLGLTLHKDGEKAVGVK